MSETWTLAVNAAREVSGFGENDALSITSSCGRLTSATSIDFAPEGSVTRLAGVRRSIAAVGIDVCDVVPGVFLAVTVTRIVLSMSAATSV